MTVNHSSLLNKAYDETAYVDLTNTEKLHKDMAKSFLVKSQFYQFDEPTFVELISKGKEIYLLSNELKFTKLLYICYSPEFDGHVFKGMASDVIPKLEKVEFYVRIKTTSILKLKHIDMQDTGFYKTREKEPAAYKPKKKKLPTGIEIEFPKE